MSLVSKFIGGFVCLCVVYPVILQTTRQSLLQIWGAVTCKPKCVKSFWTCFTVWI